MSSTSVRALAAGLLALILGVSGAGGAETNVPEAIVAEVRFSPKGLIERAEAKQLVTLAVPGPRDDRAVERTRKNLLATGRFRSVQPSWSVESGHGILTFVLEQAPFVRDIPVVGAGQLGTRQILGRLDLRKWEALADASLQAVPAQVGEAYERAGLPRPEVTVTSETAGPKGETRVRLEVAETPLPHPSAFRSELGELPLFSSLETRWRLFTFRWGMKRAGFNRKKLDEVTRAEQRRLRVAGWKGATFRTADEGGEEVLVTLDLGPREVVKGKDVPRSVMKEVSDGWRRRNVPLSEGVINRLGRSAADGMKEKGWLAADVRPRLEEKDGKKTALLEAAPGVRSYVGSVLFEGAPPLPEKDLRKAVQVSAPSLFGIVRSRPGPKALEESSAGLTALLVKSGYPDSRVTPRLEGDERKTVVFHIEAGKRRTVASVSFPGAASIDEKQLKKLVKIAPGAPWWPVGANAAAEAIRRAYGAKGFDAATVTVRAGAEESDGRVPVAFEVVEGASFLLGPSIVKGNFKTKAGRIVAMGTEKRGRPLDPERLALHQTRLSALGVFDSVAVRAEEVEGASPPEKAAVIEVKERPTGYYEWGADLNTQRGLELAGLVGERDLFGMAVNGSVSVLAGKERQNFVASLSQPILLGLRLYNGIKVSYTNDATYEGFTLVTTAGDLGFSWEIEEKKRLTITYRLERQTPTNVQPDFDAALAPETVRIGSITPSVSLDQRDDPFVPRRGTFVLGQVKISRKAFGGQSEFNRWEFDARGYKTLGDRVTVATALRGGYATTFQGQELPVGERFYAGGANTQRGFREKELGPLGTDGSPLGGMSYAVANAEVRFPIFGLLEGGAFLDVGNVYLGRIDVTDLRWAAGAGLRIVTPVGPLRVDVGRKLDVREGESTWVGHIALGYPF
jgi:outer membrane protein insertion porin family